MSGKKVTIGDMVKDSFEQTSNKILKEVDDLAEKWATYTEWGAYGFIGAAAFIGIAAMLDSYMNNQNRHRMYKQQRIQERKLREKTEKDLEHRRVGIVAPPGHAGIVQKLFDNRIGHTNTWGGVRY